MQQFREAMSRTFRLPGLMTAACLTAAILPHMTVAQRAVGPLPDPDPFVSSIFTDSMVLRRDKPDKIWGWSDPGDRITVQMGDKSAMAVAGPSVNSNAGPTTCWRSIHD